MNRMLFWLIAAVVVATVLIEVATERMCVEMGPGALLHTALPVPVTALCRGVGLEP